MCTIRQGSWQTVRLKRFRQGSACEQTPQDYYVYSRSYTIIYSFCASHCRGIITVHNIYAESTETAQYTTGSRCPYADVGQVKARLRFVTSVESRSKPSLMRRSNTRCSGSEGKVAAASRSLLRQRMVRRGAVLRHVGEEINAKGNRKTQSLEDVLGVSDDTSEVSCLRY